MDRYEGTQVDGVRHGYGAEYADGKRVYEGHWKDGRRHGEGTEFKDGAVVFQGLWRLGLPHTGTGTVYEHGARFEGEYRDGRKTKGKLFVGGVLLYEGEWRCNGFNQVVKNGPGKLYRQGALVFEGDFVDNDYWTGTGTSFTNAGIALYSGAWFAGKPHGQGKQFVDGVLFYEGEMVCGQRSGHGKLFKDGSEVLFEGLFVAGREWDGWGREFRGDAGALSYEGEFKHGLYHGKGTRFYLGRQRYEGEFRHGNREGRGTQFVGDLVTYEGEWLDERRHGVGKSFKDGKLTFEGEWFADKHWEGKGEIRIAQDRRAEGEWRQGVLVGLVREFSHYSGSLLFEGEYKAGERHGPGAEFLGNQVVFKGEYKNGRRWEGRGTEYIGSLVVVTQWAEGVCLEAQEFLGDQVIFKGQYQDGMRVSGTEYTYGRVTFEGAFRGYKYHGFGTLYDLEGSVLYAGLFSDGLRYSGDWAHDAPHGQGTITLQDQRVYSGSWDRGLRHGKGQAFDEGVMCYEGNWDHGERSGEGFEILKNGEVYSGSWKHNKRHGRGIVIDPSGESRPTVWRAGQLIADDNASDETCPVCMDHLLAPAEAVCADLRHAVCADCFPKLLSCPICRFPKLLPLFFPTPPRVPR